LIVDDLDALDDRSLSPIWIALAATEHLRIVAAHRPRAADGYHPLMSRLRSARHVVFLRPDDPAAFLTTTGLRRVLRPGLATPPGRAIVVSDRRQVTVQVATDAGDSGFDLPGEGYRASASESPQIRRGGKPHEWRERSAEGPPQAGGR
jgi:hypothetical protein